MVEKNCFRTGNSGNSRISGIFTRISGSFGIFGTIFGISGKFGKNSIISGISVNADEIYGKFTKNTGNAGKNTSKSTRNSTKAFPSRNSNFLKILI